MLQPRFGEGPLEDARPPRFANTVGLVVLGSAALAYAAGLTVLGFALGALVAALALLAAATGFCTGCEAYKLAYLLAGSRSSAARCRRSPGANGARAPGGATGDAR